MTNISQTLMADERFQCCLQKRQSGLVNIHYEPPMAPTEEWEKRLDKARAINREDQDMLEYLEDFVSLLKGHSIHPEALELTLKEFEKDNSKR